jgi:hypothetical protein
MLWKQLYLAMDIVYINYSSVFFGNDLRSYLCSIAECSNVYSYEYSTASSSITTNDNVAFNTRPYIAECNMSNNLETNIIYRLLLLHSSSYAFYFEATS